MENKQALVRIDQKVLEDFLFSTETKLTEQHKKLFFALAIRNQLDPFRREIYAIPYEKDGKIQLSVVTGYEVYLKRAERSKMLDGWKCWTEGIGDNLKAKVKIHRKDWKEPFEHEVSFKEYNLKRSLWNMKPETMLKKVAIAQAFRLAFSEEVGGMPYTSDEIEGHDIVDVTPLEKPENKSEPKPETPPSTTEQPSEKDIPEKPVWWHEASTEKQHGAIFAMGKKLGLTEDGIKSKCFSIVGHPIESIKELTRGECGKIIDTFQQEKK